MKISQVVEGLSRGNAQLVIHAHLLKPLLPVFVGGFKSGLRGKPTTNAMP